MGMPLQGNWLPSMRRFWVRRLLTARPAQRVRLTVFRRWLALLPGEEVTRRGMRDLQFLRQ